MGAKIDPRLYIGNRYGHLVIAEPDDSQKGNKVICVCDCGRRIPYKLRDLRYGVITSCGCKGRESPTTYIGKKYGRLTIVNCYQNGKRYEAECVCECGKKVTTWLHNLKQQLVTHCDTCNPSTMTRCSEKNHSHERLYRIWGGIKTRCYNPNHRSYKYYGARGIKMCDEWLYDYMVFRKWALANGFIENSGRNDCTVERKDYNGNYEPSNCKIIPMREQLYNKRNNHKLEYNGETHCVSEWIEILGLNRDIVWYRVKKKLPVEEILYKGRLSDKRKNEIQGGMYG